MTPARWMELHDWLSRVDAEAALWLEELHRAGQTGHIPGSAPSDLMQIQWYARHAARRLEAHAENAARPPQPVGRKVEDQGDDEDE